MYLEYRYISIYIYSICKITSLSKYKCKLPSFTCMSSLNKYFKRKKTKNLLCFGILFPKGELQKFHWSSRQIAPESLPVSGNVFCLKKKSFDSQTKKSQYIMWQIIARIAKGNNFILQIKKFCVYPPTSLYST